MTNILVKRSYNIAAESYIASRGQFKNGKYLEILNSFLPSKSTILDVGCGAGKPVDSYLVDTGHKVMGIDISEQMINLAKKNVPSASFQVMDMSELTYNQYLVDGVVSLYAIFHIPRESHPVLFKKIRSFLKPKGIILVTMGSSNRKAKKENFFSVPMFWSQYEPKINRKIIESAGFQIIIDEIDTSGNQHHQIIIARTI